MNTRKSIPRCLRRAPWERATAALIGLGLVMLMQPWSMLAYSYSFIVLLAGVIGYSVAGKLPANPHRHPRGGGDPGHSGSDKEHWIPASAGMTTDRSADHV